MTEILKKEFSRRSFLKGGGAVVAGASLAAAGVAGTGRRGVEGGRDCRVASIRRSSTRGSSCIPTIR